MPLNDTQIKHAKPKEKPYKLTDGEGLYLLVNPNGKKYWRMNYRFAGKGKTLAFGVYPDVSLALARDKRQNARELLAQGTDPSAKKTEDKLLSNLQSEDTFQAIAEEWLEINTGKWTEQTENRIKRRLELHVFKPLGSLPISDIKPQMVLSVIRNIEKGNRHETAHRCNQYINGIFRYAIVTGRADYNPAADLKDALKPIIKQNYAALDIKELPAFWKKLEYNEVRMFEQTRLAIKLMIYTFVRTGELINATWDEIDFENRQWIPVRIIQHRLASPGEGYMIHRQQMRQAGALAGGDVFLAAIDHIAPEFQQPRMVAIVRQNFRRIILQHLADLLYPA